MTDSTAACDAIDHAERVLGVTFSDPGLLSLALRHASSSESRLDSNERLEFLGDAILGAVACDRIYTLFPDLLEGEMTKIKSTVVSRKTCAQIASRLGLEACMDVGKGVMEEDRLPSSLAAGVMESVIGAVYLDQGYARVHDLIVGWFDPVILQAADSDHHQNFKSVLQQHAQSHFATTPTYRVLDEQGPDHAKAFKIAVELDGVVYAACWGQSKKQAEQQAARATLEALKVLETEPGASA